MAMLSTLIVVIILQCIHTSNHQIVPLRYISFLFVNDSSIKLKKEKIMNKTKEIASSII